MRSRRGSLGIIYQLFTVFTPSHLFNCYDGDNVLKALSRLIPDTETILLLLLLVVVDVLRPPDQLHHMHPAASSSVGRDLLEVHVLVGESAGGEGPEGRNLSRVR